MNSARFLIFFDALPRTIFSSSGYAFSGSECHLADQRLRVRDLARRAQGNKELKRDALQKLSIMNNDEALAYMLQILNE